ncbi:MAG: hypothetical protein PHE55_17075 [Methylococcaceae bacterium]|nr:hypothetical protein [Methylococcaceae bacterium]
MKYLFFLILLANIVFYLWETGVGRQIGQDAQKVPEAGERIVLLKEIPAKSEPQIMPPAPQAEVSGAEPEQAAVSAAPAQDEAAPVEPAPPPPDPPADTQVAETPIASQADAADQTPNPPPPTPDSVCYHLGPYVSPKKAIAASIALGGASRAEVVKQPTEVEAGYTVLYPPAESLQVARENLKAMQGKGFKDAWVLEKGDYRYAVSLAMFSDKERAEAAVAHFRGMGIPAELKPRMVPGNTWWLRIPGSSAERPALEEAAGKPQIGAGTAKLGICE